MVPDPSADFLSAYGGVTAWSRDAGPRYRLVIRSRGRTGDAPVRGFRHPVDADLGPGRLRREIVAVYARCRAGNRHCDLYQYSLRTRRERKLRRLSSRRRSERSPSAWGGRYLFGRSRRGLFKAGPLLRLSRRVPIDTDLRRRTALYSYEDVEGATVAMRRFGRRNRGRSCVISESSEASSGGWQANIGPVAIAGDFLYWLGYHAGPAFSIPNPPAPFEVLRTRTPTARCASRSGEAVASIWPSGAVWSFSVSRGQLLYTDDRGVVRVTPTPRWDD